MSQPYEVGTARFATDIFYDRSLGHGPLVTSRTQEDEEAPELPESQKTK
jgi:hypothetical protein